MPFKLGEVTACSRADGNGLPKRNTEEREPLQKVLESWRAGFSPEGSEGQSEASLQGCEFSPVPEYWVGVGAEQGSSGYPLELCPSAQ